MISGEFKSHVEDYIGGSGCCEVIKSYYGTFEEPLSLKECSAHLVMTANGLGNNAIMNLQKYSTCGGSGPKKNGFGSYDEECSLT